MTQATVCCLKRLESRLGALRGLLSASAIMATPSHPPCSNPSHSAVLSLVLLPFVRHVQDGQEILRSERIRAQQQLPQLHQQLLADLTAAGIDPVAAAAVEDDSMYDPDQEVAETGYLDPETGEMKRPWCAATRILEHREQVGGGGVTACWWFLRVRRGHMQPGNVSALKGPAARCLCRKMTIHLCEAGGQYTMQGLVTMFASHPAAMLPAGGDCPRG